MWVSNTLVPSDRTKSSSHQEITTMDMQCTYCEDAPVSQLHHCSIVRLRCMHHSHFEAATEISNPAESLTVAGTTRRLHITNFTTGPAALRGGVRHNKVHRR